MLDPIWTNPVRLGKEIDPDFLNKKNLMTMGWTGITPQPTSLVLLVTNFYALNRLKIYFTRNSTILILLKKNYFRHFTLL